MSHLFTTSGEAGLGALRAALVIRARVKSCEDSERAPLGLASCFTGASSHSGPTLVFRNPPAASSEAHHCVLNPTNHTTQALKRTAIMVK